MTFRSLAACLSLLALCHAAPVWAAEDATHTLVISGDDGYGTSACLADGSSCGQIVADALCESKGFSKALAFHKAEPDEITASIDERPVTKDAFVINCSE